MCLFVTIIDFILLWKNWKKVKGKIAYFICFNALFNICGFVIGIVYGSFIFHDKDNSNLEKKIGYNMSLGIIVIVYDWCFLLLWFGI